MMSLAVALWICGPVRSMTSASGDDVAMLPAASAAVATSL
jgi:hypothetical protein